MRDDLVNVVYAATLCSLVAGMFAAATCLIAALWPPTRAVVTTRIFVLMTLWGTVFVFAGALVPYIVA